MWRGRRVLVLLVASGGVAGAGITDFLVQCGYAARSILLCWRLFLALWHRQTRGMFCDLRLTSPHRRWQGWNARHDADCASTDLEDAPSPMPLAKRTTDNGLVVLAVCTAWRDLVMYVDTCRSRRRLTFVSPSLVSQTSIVPGWHGWAIERWGACLTNLLVGYLCCLS